MTRAAVLSWRLERHHLGARGADSVVDVVERLVAVPAWSGDAALATGLRLDRSATPAPGDEREGDAAGMLRAALADGRLVKVFTFRGATHLMTPRQAADHLALRAAGRMWERSSWVEHYRLPPAAWPDLRATVRGALADGPLPPAAVAEVVARDPRWAHLREPLSTLGTFLKPFFWQGDVCLGPDADGTPTLAALEDNPRWPGLPELDEAGRRAVTSYLSAYGPAAPARLHYWLGEGLGAGRRRIDRWLTDLAPALATVEVDGEEVLVLADDLEQVVGGPAEDGQAAQSVRLLPGHDQWVLGPGTADTTVVPPEHRQQVTRGANLLLVGGVVRGAWTVRDGVLAVTLGGASDGGPVVDLLTGPLADDLADQVARVGGLRGESLDLVVGSPGIRRA